MAGLGEDREVPGVELFGWDGHFANVEGEVGVLGAVFNHDTSAGGAAFVAVAGRGYDLDSKSYYNVVLAKSEQIRIQNLHSRWI